MIKGQNELPLKETACNDAPIVFGNKADALTVSSLLCEDQKQPNGSYRFCIHKHVVPLTRCKVNHVFHSIFFPQKVKFFCIKCRFLILLSEKSERNCKIRNCSKLRNVKAKKSALRIFIFTYIKNDFRKLRN